ncbi:hypothetical protein AWV79_27105 [Cupriavidus sp. UYMMa02A]|nr:hypothetical protein AWV79_27105 [Cupriavidus sp. UYMMa02A]
MEILNEKVLKAILALGAASACGVSATAIAQTSSINLYGVADLGIVHESGAAAGSVTKMTSGMMSGSRFGMRGREDLGGGTAAFFTLEGGVLMDTGALAKAACFSAVRHTSGWMEISDGLRSGAIWDAGDGASGI